MCSHFRLTKQTNENVAEKSLGKKEKLAKFLLSLLGSFTTNGYTIKDSFTFAEELQNFDFKFVMASFEIESPLTNVSLQKTIDLC